MGIDPITGTLMAVGAATSAMGAMSQANAARQASSFNAAVAQQDSVAAGQQSAAEQARFARQSRAIQGRAAAGAAESGLVASYGSMADAQLQSAIDLELDAMTLAYRGGLRQRGLDTEAQLHRMEGRAARRQGAFGAAGALLQGGANIAMLRGR
jgi:hypothetical protein